MLEAALVLRQLFPLAQRLSEETTRSTREGVGARTDVFDDHEVPVVAALARLTVHHDFGVVVAQPGHVHVGAGVGGHQQIHVKTVAVVDESDTDGSLDGRFFVLSPLETSGLGPHLKPAEARLDRLDAEQAPAIPNRCGWPGTGPFFGQQVL